MHAHSESEIRKSFINCSKGAAQRINIPHEVAQAAWDQLIFLSWIDPKSPRTGYVVAETENGLRGLVLEKNPHKGKGGARMCQICLTLHPGSGVSMVSIQRTKSAKDHYNTVGTYLCSDLACSDYTLGKKKPEGIRQMEETMGLEDRVDRTLANVQGLINRVADAMGGRA
ncbi:FBP domain-containing protein [Kocuria marina]|uniref:FBP domain-containing protein n=1 Tax=Kocuria marina TaxID=223184 RepID=UPI003F1EDC46